MALRVLLFVALAFVPYAAFGQADGAPGPAPATGADLEAFAMRIEARIGQLQKDNESRFKALEDGVKPFADRLKTLEDNVKTLSEVQQSSRQALDQLAKTDKEGKSYLRLDASHEPTRLELRSAMEEATPKRGTVVIRNKTNSTQAVSVNGTTYDVLADSERPIEVPYQRFEVRTTNNRTLNWDFRFPKTTAVVNINYIPSTPESNSTAAASTYVLR